MTQTLAEHETEAEQAILAAGYTLKRRGEDLVEATEPSLRASGRGRPRTWIGTSCRDLARAFGLHRRKANPKPKGAQ